jgi:hypothetical protein
MSHVSSWFLPCKVSTNRCMGVAVASSCWKDCKVVGWVDAHDFFLLVIHMWPFFSSDSAFKREWVHPLTDIYRSTSSAATNPPLVHPLGSGWILKSWLIALHQRDCEWSECPDPSRLVLRTQTKGSPMSCYKRIASFTLLDVLRGWDANEATREAWGREFESRTAHAHISREKIAHVRTPSPRVFLIFFVQITFVSQH